MSEVFHDFQVHHLYLCALVIFICFATILIAMTIDLIAGIQKAKELHIARTSTGLKKTCDKAKKYFPTFGIASLMDVATCIISPFPLFAIAWTVYLLLCEFKSIREKAYEKAEIRKQDRTMQVILENKDEIAKAVVEIMKEERKKGGDNEDNQSATNTGNAECRQQGRHLSSNHQRMGRAFPHQYSFANGALPRTDCPRIR